LSSKPLVGFWKVRGGTVLSVLLLVVLALVISQFFTTYRFYVYGVEVQGNQFVDASEIYNASGLHELSIFWINPEKMEATISKLPGVKEAKVKCRLPNRVTIQVVERQTHIIWDRGGQRYGVDDRGTVLALEGELEGMILVQDLTPGPLEVGGHINPAAIASALELRRLRPEITALQYSEERGLSFNQADSPIYLGTGDMAEKMVILSALLQDLAFEGIQPEFVDVRFPESPYYKY
jgi:cell division septal protein FtsQ